MFVDLSLDGDGGVGVSKSRSKVKIITDEELFSEKGRRKIIGRKVAKNRLHSILKAIYELDELYLPEDDLYLVEEGVE